MRRRYLCGALVAAVATAAALSAASGRAAGTGSSMQLAKPSVMRVYKGKGSNPARPRRTNNLAYQGGVGGIGVETAPKVYLVLWGSQWTGNDPSGESNLLQSFFTNVGGSPWMRSVTQYCQGVARGTTTCPFGSAFAGGGVAFSPGQVWSDTGSPAPSQPTQSQLAGEAINAANHFGNTTAASNQTVQYVIATSKGHSASGFGTQYCAWHSSTSSASGNIAYTNLPYITDAGASCGANFNNLGPFAGITIVEGHEMAETITDQFPNGGWLDGSGAENGDKCAWTSATSIQPIGGSSFPVQPLWSNASSSCVLSY